VARKPVTPASIARFRHFPAVSAACAADLTACCHCLLQLCHIVRLLDVNTALARLPDKQRRDAAYAQLNSSSSGGSTPVVAALAGAAAVVAKLRDACGYHWVNLGQLFGRLRNGSSQQQQQRAGGMGLSAVGTPVRVA
jgi:hypothetical protein